jgi:hypothetical protein
VRTQFPGNIVPADRISSAAQQILGYIPNPDLNGIANNLRDKKAGTWPSFDTYTPILEIDHNITAAQRLSSMFTTQFRQRDSTLASSEETHGEPARHVWILSETYAAMSSFVQVPGGVPAFYDARPVPHGDVRMVLYESKSMGVTRWLWVYAPPGYERSRDRLDVVRSPGLPVQGEEGHC